MRSSRAASSVSTPAQMSRRGLQTITLGSADGSTQAEFVPGANMVCCSLRYHGLEFLDPGDGIAAYAERGRTMGIPLLHPWANRLEGVEYCAAGRRVVLPRDQAVIAVDESGLPIHGVIPRRMRWHVAALARHALVSVLNWRTPELLELFPFEHELRLEVTIERGRLEVVTTLRATGREPVPVAFGYHPYLRIPGVDRDAWQVTFAESERLLLDERMIPTGRRVPLSRRSLRLGDRGFDDAFAALSVPAQFRVAGGGLALTADFLDGFRYAQDFTPPAAGFICFEPMAAPTNALNSGDGLTVVQPGGEYRSAFAISIADSVGGGAQEGST